MKQTIFITGGAGFIGSHLAGSHFADGDEVHILVRPGSRLYLARLPDEVVVHDAPLGDAALLRRCLADVQPDVVYHLATDAGRSQSLPSIRDIGSLTSDLTNLLTLVSVAAELPLPPRTIVRAGSIAEYGDGPAPSVEGQRERPMAAYTTCSVAGAHFISLLGEALAFPVVQARFALTYGPYQSENFLLPWLISRCLQGVPSDIRRPGDRRDLIHVDDLVAGLRAMAESDLENGTILNLSTGQAPTMREVVALVLERCGVDASLVTFADEPCPDLRVQALCGSPEKARDMIGWQARISLAEGLDRLVAWHQQKVYA